jgi:phosphodiesterase/alkaline phosphatase D-like protein
VSGDAKLVAKAVASRASYEWQYSTDQKTWTDAPTTLQSKTDVVGLTPGTAYFFRFRGTTKAGVGDWSQVVSMLMT